MYKTRYLPEKESIIFVGMGQKNQQRNFLLANQIRISFILP